MVIRKKLLAVFGLILIVSSSLHAQIRRGDWSGGFVFTTTNNVYAHVMGNFLNRNPDVYVTGSAEDLYRWYFPEFRQRFAYTTIDTPAGSGKTDFWDWGMRNFSVGYHILYSPRVSHVGFELQVDFDKEYQKIKLPSDDQYYKYNKYMIVPTALIKFRFGDYTRNNRNVQLEIGGSYDYTFNASGSVEDLDAFNNGFAGIIGLGYFNTKNGSGISIRYTHDFYDYFNSDYSPSSTSVKPFDGIKTNRGTFEIITIFRIN